MFANNHPTGVIKGWNAPLDGARPLSVTIANESARPADGIGIKRGTDGADANETTTHERNIDMANKKKAAAQNKVAAKKPAKKTADKACQGKEKKATAKKGAKKTSGKAK